MGERVFINDLIPITDIDESSKLLVDQGGYKKITYNDFVIDVVNTVKSSYNDSWNAQMLDGTNINIEVPQNGEVITYNSVNSRFENSKLESRHIDWSGIDTNEYKFLQVNSAGQVRQNNITIPSLRMDNDFSGGFFLKVKNDGTQQIEASDLQNELDSGSYTVNAQTLQGNQISDLDNRYMVGSNNLSDLTDLNAARTTLGVATESESDNRYVSKTQNLSDVSDAQTSFNNIKQTATFAYAGVIELANSVEVQDGLRNDLAVVPSTLNVNYYNKTSSDGRYLQRSNNLSDVNDLNAARDTLNIYSKTETDSRYLQKGLNLSELTSKSVARDNLDVYDKAYIDQFTLNTLNNLSDVDNVSQAQISLNVYDKSDVYTKVESNDRFVNGDLDLGTTNLNFITGEGFFHQPSNSLATNSRNYPLNIGGSLLVQKSAGDGASQIYISYASSTRMFIRNYYQSAWYPWKEMGNISTYDFDSSISTNGYQKLPSGLIMQWGIRTVAVNQTSTAVSYPIPFPSLVYNIQLTIQYAGYVSGNLVVYHGNQSSTGFTIYGDHDNAAATVLVHWFAIGK